MPFVSEIAKSLGTLKDVTFEWRIKNFFSLSEKPDEYYRSPIFTFSDSFWFLTVYPNGQSRNHSVGWIDFYLVRDDDGAAKTVTFKLGIKNLSAKEICLKHKFSNSQKEMGELKWLSREELLKCKDMMPSDILTVYCKLKCLDFKASRTSVLSRMREVGRNLHSILVEGKSADFTIICKDRRWPVHKAILRSRSEYFDTMFCNKWKESTSGLLKFTEIDENSLDSVLLFIYTGEVEDLSDDNVCSLCDSANIFALVDLKKICVDYLKRNMGPDLVFGALHVAQTYMEEELMEHSLNYVIQESDKIFEKEEWKQFKAENPYIAMKILEKMVVKEGEISKRIKLTASA